jgi:hypothetical protein
MTILRRRMTEDMRIRNLSSHTQASYLQQVTQFALAVPRPLPWTTHLDGGHRGCVPECTSHLRYQQISHDGSLLADRHE